jgi:hypothetical protein
VIPAGQYDPKRADTLMEYLVQELRDAQAARKPLEESWVKWDNAYRCIPSDEKKDFPFEGAANLVVPVIATDVDTLFSRFMGILFAPSNLWSVGARRPEMMDVAPRVQEFLEWAQDNEIKPYDPICDWMLEMCKKGTGVLKQRYTRRMKKVYEWRELDSGIWQQQANILLEDHPSMHHVQLADFYLPAYATDIQEAPWTAERVMLTFDQYMERVAAGVYQNIENFSQWYANSRGSVVEQNMQALDRFRPSYGRRFEMFEFWVDFDIDGDLQREALVCTIHPESRTYCRLDYNPFFNQDKPYSIARYMRVEKRFYGLGLCEMLWPFQEEVSTQHNQRIDGGTVANSVMLKAKTGIGIREDEPIYPGRIWLLDNPESDLMPLRMGEKFDSTVNDENLTVAYAAKRTGVNDYVSGVPSAAAAYGPAYTTQQMLQAGAKRFDQTLREVRVALSESGTRVLELYQQFNQRGKEFIALGNEDGAMVHQVLQFPLDLIRKGLSVTVTAIDASNSKEAKIRTNTIIMQQLTQFYMQYMQGMQYLVNPMVPPPIKQVVIDMLKGGSIIFRRILDDYGVQDASRVIPELQGAIDDQFQQLAALSQSFGGGAGGGGGPSGQPGVAIVPSGVQGTGRAGGQVAPAA